MIDTLKVEDEKAKETWVELPKSIPPSAIVQTNGKRDSPHDLSSFKLKARLLFNKYVMEGSDFEVNIDSKMRQRLSQLIGDGIHGNQWIYDNNMEAAELAMVFDGVIEQMLLLLSYSASRFRERARSGDLMSCLDVTLQSSNDSA